MLISSFCFGTDWIYVGSSSTESFWVDRSYYHYHSKTNTVDVWSKSVKKKINDDEFYTDSKSLDRYTCTGKSMKNLAYVEYFEGGAVSKTITTPSRDFSIIFPDSIAEGIWEVACKSKGKGFIFTKSQLETISILDLQQKYGKGTTYIPEEVPSNMMQGNQFEPEIVPDHMLN